MSNIFNIDLKKIKSICKMIDNFLNYPFDPDITKAYCLGFVLAIAIYSDIDMQSAQDLNMYVEIKSKATKEKSTGVH